MDTVFAASSHRSVLPAGWDHARAHAALRALLESGDGADGGCLFAAPRATEAGIAFDPPADGQRATYAALDAAQRSALRAELGRLASVLRRAAALRAARDPARDGDLPALVAAALEIPSFAHVLAWAAPGAAGRPVLLGWGLVPADAPGPIGLVTRLDDGRPADAPRRTPWALLGIAALALLATGALAALLAPSLLSLVAPPEPVCRVAPGQMAALETLLREEERERALRRRLAELERDLGLKRAACPLPEPPRPPEPPPRAEPQAPPPPQPQPQPPPAPVPPPPPPPAPPPSPPTPPPQPERAQTPPEPPPNTQACDTETESGGQGVTTHEHFLGDRPGRVQIDYANRQQADHIRVYYRGQLIAETPGPVSGTGEIAFDWAPRPGGPDAYTVQIVVIGPGRGTVWAYRLACPK
jgi:hypothetical protein